MINLLGVGSLGEIQICRRVLSDALHFNLILEDAGILVLRVETIHLK